MTISSSNTYVLPSQGAAIAISRAQYNGSLKALLQNFYSEAPPNSENLIETGDTMPITDLDGMLFRNSRNNVLYIHDSNLDSRPSEGVTLYPIAGTKFSRYGIAWRIEPDLATAETNMDDYDIGEGFVMVRGDASHNRLYYRAKSTGSFSSDFVDVGLPPPGSINAESLGEKVIGGLNLADLLDRDTYYLTVKPGIIATNEDQHDVESAALIVDGSGTDAIISLLTTDSDTMLRLRNGRNGLSVEDVDSNPAPVYAGSIIVPEVSNNQQPAVDSGWCNLIPAGIVVAWTATTAPSGWKICNGQSLSRTTYAQLFANIGTTFGSDNGSTFKVPDLRGRSPYGLYSDSLNNTGTNGARVGTDYILNTTSESLSSHNATTINYQQPSLVKDQAPNGLTTGVTDHAQHNHKISLPGLTLNYIIRT